jgi:ethanolamine utilization microcompartment shell protein EutL
MAGNDGDLLKQATQAMMARYEGESTFLWALEAKNTHIHAHCSDFFVLRDDATVGAQISSRRTELTCLI